MFQHPLSVLRGRIALIGGDPTSEAKGIRFKMLAISPHSQPSELCWIERYSNSRWSSNFISRKMTFIQ